MSHYRVYTSEAVGVGHPDRLCDIVSDSLVDHYLRHDPMAMANVTTLASAGHCSLYGEVDTTAHIDSEVVVRQRIRELGYTSPALQFMPTVKIDTHIRRQPLLPAELPHAAVGFACRDNGEFLPSPFVLARHVARRIDTMRMNGMLAYLRPDTRVRVSVVYKNSRPVKVSNVEVRVTHDHTVDVSQIQDDIFVGVVEPTLYDFEMEISRQDVHINGNAGWYAGGPAAQAGMSGRLVAASGYGGFSREPQRTLHGLDGAQLPRAGAYAARYVAKNIIAAGLAQQVEVLLHYNDLHGQPQIYLTTFSTGTASARAISDFAAGLLDLTLAGCINSFKLRTPHYAATAMYGHFGNADFPWEQLRPSV